MNQQPVPFPFSMLPWLAGQQQLQQPPTGREEPPARVLVALDVLARLTQKTAQWAAANGIEIRVEDGQKLTTAEANAQAAAANLLADYLAGKLEPNSQEALEMDKGRRALPISDRPGVVIRCVMCQQALLKEPNASCILCKGTGQLLVYPTVMGE